MSTKNEIRRISIVGLTILIIGAIILISGILYGNYVAWYYNIISVYILMPIGIILTIIGFTISFYYLVKRLRSAEVSQSDVRIVIREAKSHYEVGLRHVKKGMLSKALENFNKALKVTPMNPEVLSAKGTVLIKMGKYEEALEALNLALEVDPTLKSAIESKEKVMQYQKSRDN